jgi:hypothetical protein
MSPIEPERAAGPGFQTGEDDRCLVELLPGEPPRQARQIATGAIATMVGSIVLSRAVGSGKLSDRILDAGRKTAGGRTRKAPAKNHKGDALQKIIT